MPILPFLLLGGILAFSGPKKKPTRDWWKEEDRKKPPNISGNPLGYNQKVFGSEFAIKMAFAVLGYGINPFDKTYEGVPEIINPAIVKQFQRDYNALSSYGVDGQKYDGISVPSDFGYVETDGNIGPETLNALEHALSWAKISALGGRWQNAADLARKKGYY